jgi:hypothetical protein
MKIASVVGLCLLLTGLAQGQFEHTVTFAGGYVMDGTLKKPLVLVRGYTYTFNLVSISSAHPFKFTSSSTGGSGTPVYTNGVTGTPASGTTTVTFHVTEDAPDVLYYQCDVHANLGARIDIKDPPRLEALDVVGEDLVLRVTNLLATTTTVLRASDLTTGVWTTDLVFSATSTGTNLTLSAGPELIGAFLRVVSEHP